MRQRHAFGLTFRAGGEKDYGRKFMRRARSYQPRHELPDAGNRLVEDRKFLADILKINRFRRFGDFGRQRVQFRKLYEPVRRDDALDHGGTHGAHHPGRAAREIQHRRDAAEGGDRKESDDRSKARRQHDAHGVAARRSFLQGMAERQRGPHQLVIGQDFVVAVDHGRARAAEARASLDQRFEQRHFVGQQIQLAEFQARRGGNAWESQWISPTRRARPALLLLVNPNPVIFHRASYM